MFVCVCVNDERIIRVLVLCVRVDATLSRPQRMRIVCVWSVNTVLPAMIGATVAISSKCVYVLLLCVCMCICHAVPAAPMQCAADFHVTGSVSTYTYTHTYNRRATFTQPVNYAWVRFTLMRSGNSPE